MLIDKLSAESGIAVKRRSCEAIVGRGEIAGRGVTLAKPQTYMNLSGQAVGCLMAKEDLAAASERVIVISDDLALPFGRIRIRARGSAGGHNGLKSIIDVLGTDAFTRLRIGIQPDHPIADSKRFVLDQFPKGMRSEVETIVTTSGDAVRTILRDGVLKAMTQYNG